MQQTSKALFASNSLALTTNSLPKEPITALPIKSNILPSCSIILSSKQPKSRVPKGGPTLPQHASSMTWTGDLVGEGREAGGWKPIVSTTKASSTPKTHSVRPWIAAFRRGLTKCSKKMPKTSWVGSLRSPSWDILTKVPKTMGDPCGMGWCLGRQIAQNSVESGPPVLVLVSLEG